jgi:hypothetical protein
MTRRKIAAAAIAGTVLGIGGLCVAAPAGADPAPVPQPGAPIPAGQPVADAPGGDALAAPAPPPVGPPPVPEIANPVYGSGHSNGPLGFLRDAWHQARDPYNFAETPEGEAPPEQAPPGAGPAPQLPPGYVSLTDPASNGPAVTTDRSGGPALPPGYYPLNGPPPPGYFDAPAADPSAPPPGMTPIVAPPTH